MQSLAQYTEHGENNKPDLDALEAMGTMSSCSPPVAGDCIEQAASREGGNDKIQNLSWDIVWSMKLFLLWCCEYFFPVVDSTNTSCQVFERQSILSN